ncbi:hypothetical protein [Methylotenera versatilis]|uniref:hypothetical protein n=1 Tax=Methylotenera versatilis TaxID=1055487 RepID=UPI00064657A9|nr:hypothetical protein [Methylotenera versatilis]
MLIKYTKTSADLNDVDAINLAEIVREVNQHGFYSAYCAILMRHIDDHDVLIGEIKKMAIRANLQVTFNTTETICIFEAF